MKNRGGMWCLQSLDTLLQLPFHENRDTKTPYRLENKKIW